MTTTTQTQLPSPTQMGFTLFVGAIAVLILGLQPVVLGGLAAEHRLATDQIGVAATVELVAMGAASSIAAAVFKPTGLRMKGILACLCHGIANLATLAASGTAVIVARGAAGACAGVMLWLAIAAIATSNRPDRIASIFATTQTLAQLAAASLISALITPRYGANGALVCLAVISWLTALCCLGTPDRLTQPPPTHEAASPINLAAGAGLLAVFFYLAGVVSVWVYMEPLGKACGLTAQDLALIVPLTLGCQAIGATVATVIGRRLSVYPTLIAVTLALAALIVGLGHTSSHAVFIVSSAAYGFVWLFAFPLQTQMVIDLDPSRRAAMQLGAAQLLGSSAGPLVAALVVGDGDARHAITLAVGFLALSLGLVVILALRRNTHSPLIPKINSQPR